jgi:hypothetical protein
VFLFVYSFVCFLIYLTTLSVTQTIQSECSVPSNLLCYAVPHNRYTLLLENISLYFVLQQVFERVSGSYMPGNAVSVVFFALFQTFISERDCSPLQCFYKVCTQSNQQLALSRLMHSMHCGSAVFPYQALKEDQHKSLIDTYQSLLHTHSSQFSSELHVSAQCGHHQVGVHVRSHCTGIIMYTEVSRFCPN